MSRHGINGTVGGEIDACKQYLKRTREFGPFAGLEVKWSEGSGFDPVEAQPLKGTDRRTPWKQISDFPKLNVKVRDELVAFGTADELQVDANGVVGGGTHLSPTAVNELVAERGDDVVFFDGRNAYEAAIGRFAGAVVPEVASTHGFIGEIERGAFDDLKHRPVVTYCTGGIRCEVLSAAMIERGFTEVYQIDGGIVRYGEQFGNDGLWEGSLAVFDGRETMDFAAGAAVVGKCAVCGTASSTLSNCVDLSCRARYVVCADHEDSRCTDHGGDADARPASIARSAQSA